MPSATPRQEELYTAVESLLDTDRTFSFLGDQGIKLAAGEIVVIRGDIRTTLAPHRRKFNALQRSLQRGSIRIRSTPPPILYDPGHDVSKALALQSGTLGTVDPSYNDPYSESAHP